MSVQRWKGNRDFKAILKTFQQASEHTTEKGFPKKFSSQCKCKKHFKALTCEHDNQVFGVTDTEQLPWMGMVGPLLAVPHVLVTGQQRLRATIWNEKTCYMYRVRYIMFLLCSQKHP